MRNWIKENEYLFFSVLLALVIAGIILVLVI
jgi:hypothetical protein